MDKIKRFHPGKVGLYDFANEHDACGVGFVANIHGEKSHKIVEQGVEVLIKLQHRGALGGDNATGDGAGILIQIPDEFFRLESKKLKINLPAEGEYGVAMIFLPHDEKLKKICIGEMENAVKSNGLSLLGWRDVAVNPSCLGRLAAETCPCIKQLFIGTGTQKLDNEALERKLYISRRCAEKAVEAYPEIGESFYVVSMSSRTIVYKGLLLAPQIPAFYPDLSSEAFKSALAVVHQRYSTNTFPTWHLAHPFRFLAHNGEINTLRGNVNQMRAREKSFKCEKFGDDMQKVLPVIREGLSDSASLDNAFEFFYEAGRTMPHTAMMLIPQAWGEKYTMGKDLRGFFEYHAGLMEPWDGPAAVVFSNGKAIGAILDRNGLRPSRYTITKDGFMVLASEAGVLEIDPSNVKHKGRLSPGQMIYIDIENKRVMFGSTPKSRCILPARSLIAAGLKRTRLFSQASLIQLFRLRSTRKHSGRDRLSSVTQEKSSK